MNNLISLKRSALQLRKQGKSYNEINKVLGIPKSTLSSWLKNLPLSETVKNRNIQKAKLIWAKNITDYNKIRSLKYQEATKKLITKFAREVPALNKKSLFWIGLALFWAEGGKREKWNVRFVNSDPQIIQIIMLFFRKICKVSDEKFTLRIHLYPNIQEKVAKNYWLKITKLQEDQLRKSQVQISGSSKGKRPINRLPYGTLHINIGDAHLNKKIKGWLLGLNLQLNK